MNLLFMSERSQTSVCECPKKSLLKSPHTYIFNSWLVFTCWVCRCDALRFFLFLFFFFLFLEYGQCLQRKRPSHTSFKIVQMPPKKGRLFLLAYMRRWSMRHLDTTMPQDRVPGCLVLLEILCACFRRAHSTSPTGVNPRAFSKHLGLFFPLPLQHENSCCFCPFHLSCFPACRPCAQLQICPLNLRLVWRKLFVSLWQLDHDITQPQRVESTCCDGATDNQNPMCKKKFWNLPLLPCSLLHPAQTSRWITPHQGGAWHFCSQFTCFSSTKVLILTPEEPFSGEPMTKNEKKAAAAKPGMSKAADSHREVIVRIDLTNATLRR